MPDAQPYQLGFAGVFLPSAVVSAAGQLDLEIDRFIQGRFDSRIAAGIGTDRVFVDATKDVSRSLA